MKDLLKNPNIELADDNGEIIFDLNLLSASNFKRIIKFYDAILDSPTEYIITATIATLGGAIGKMAYFKAGEVTIYPNIYAMIIGRSTVMRKTTALRTVTKEFRKINREQWERYKKELAEYEKALKNNPKAELIEPEKNFILLPNDMTIEALTQRLTHLKRGLIMQNEIGGWLASMDKGYAKGSKQFFTEIYDVPGEYEISRITKGDMLIEHPIVSILGASTIDWIIENSKESDQRSGFFARFIYSIRNKPTKAIRTIAEKRRSGRQEINNEEIYKIYKRLINIKEEWEIAITTDALDWIDKFEKKMLKEINQNKDEAEASFLGRLIAYAYKFALIIALTDDKNVIELKDVKDAVALAEYYKKNATRLLFKELTKTEFARKEEKVYSMLINENGEWVKRRDVMRKADLKAKELNEIISNLLGKERIEKKEETKDGKKATVYYRAVDE